MFGLDDWIAGLARGGPMAFAVALLLGLRHATDPDHLTAVSSLVLGDDGQRGTRRASVLGFAWGFGHALTLLLCGLPVVWLGYHLSPALHRAAEAAVGVMIAGLALRLLLQWWRFRFHSHLRVHDGAWHAHAHAHHHANAHAHRAAFHGHPHAEAMGRTPAAAFGIGLLHGVAGSGAAGMLVIGACPDRGQAAAALLVFAAGTAVSMGLLSTALGHALLTRPLVRRSAVLVPVFGATSLVLGVTYVLLAR